MEIIDNFLSTKEFNLIKQITMSNSFPYYYHKNVAYKEDTNNFYFTHQFYDNNVPQSTHFNLIKCLLDKLNIKSLLRAKVNCFPRTEKLIKYSNHIDYEFDCKGAIYYINTCNGGTYVGKKFIQSIQNRMFLFDANKEHRSTNCTDQKCRFNININYL